MTLDEGFFAVCSTAFPRPDLVTLLEGLLIRGQVRRLFVHLSLRTGAVLRHAAGNKGKIYLSILLFYFARNNGTYLLNSFSIWLQFGPWCSSSRVSFSGCCCCCCCVCTWSCCCCCCCCAAFPLLEAEELTTTWFSFMLKSTNIIKNIQFGEEQCVPVDFGFHRSDPGIEIHPPPRWKMERKGEAVNQVRKKMKFCAERRKADAWFVRERGWKWQVRGKRKGWVGRGILINSFTGSSLHGWAFQNWIFYGKT